MRRRVVPVRMLRRAGAASVALVAVVIMAACAAIPSAGPVNAGAPAGQAPSLEQELLAAAPQPGMSQAQILEGFIDAAVDPRNNYQVAQQYLTPDFRDKWQPSAGATIDVFGDRTTETIDDRSMRVHATPSASLAANGLYALAESATSVPLDYKFQRVGGEWRISSAPPGILIDDGNFARVYHRYDLVFFDPQYRYAVPDVRWFAGRDAVQTSIVRALLAGPAQWLQGGVVSAFPNGMQAPDSVPVDGNTATVAIDGAPVDDPRTLQRMRYQLQQSLIDVRSGLQVKFTMNGAEQPADPAFQPDPDPRVDPRPAVFDGSTFGFLGVGGDQVTPIDGISERVASLRPTAASLGRRAAAAAVRSAEGVYLVRPGADPLRVDSRSHLIAPEMDGEGYIWSVPADQPAAVRATGPDGKPIELNAPWGGQSIAAMQVSRDGTRLVGQLGDGARARSVVISIQRDANGVPKAFGQTALLLQDVPGSPRNVTWIDASTVASLVEDATGSHLIEQPIGGAGTMLDAPAQSIDVDAGNSVSDLRILTATGTLETESGVAWQTRAKGIRFLATQQPG